MKRRSSSILLFCLSSLLAALSLPQAGYPAAVPSNGTVPEQAQPLAPAGTAGLFPPVIGIFEEQTGSGPAARAERSPSVEEAMSAAFIEETTGRLISLRPISREEAGPGDLTGIRAVPERIKDSGAEPVPETLLPVPYPSASVEQAMALHQLGFAWIVTGIEVKAAGEQAKGSRVLLRAALIDQKGTVLYSDMVDETGEGDLRDPETARRFVRRLLAEYRTEKQRTETQQAAEHGAAVKAAEPKSPHPAEFRAGLGIFFIAEDGVDLIATFSPANSAWQFGYRYVRWTDISDDPFTGRELTRTRETKQGPQVNYLFHPGQDRSFYLGISLLKWSRIETSLVTGVSDSDSVAAPFFGGGYTGRFGEVFFFNMGFFVSPGTDLNTDTGVSSTEDSGGFDIQLQAGFAF